MHTITKYFCTGLLLAAVCFAGVPNVPALRFADAGIFADDSIQTGLMEPIEILAVVNDSGTARVLTSKQGACVAIKEKSSGQVWRGRTNAYGIVTLDVGRALPEDTSKLEIWEESSCPRADDSNSAAIQGVVTSEIRTTDNRQLKITAPSDIRPGDMVSMSIDAGSGAALTGIVFDVEGKNVSPKDNKLTFKIPDVFIEVRYVTVRDLVGREIGRHIIPLNNAPSSGSTAMGGYHPPRFGQTGSVISIPGKYDGIAGNSAVIFTPAGHGAASTTMSVVAKSPRALFAKLPSNTPPGPGTLTINENGALHQSPFNTLNVTATADNPRIQRGQTLNAEFNVFGCKGLIEDKHEIMLIVRNFSPSVIRFKSTASNAILKRLQPDKNGVATFNEKLTGIMAGTFTVTGTVAQPGTSAPIGPATGANKCACECELAATPILTAGKRSSDGGAENSFAANVAKASCNGNKCSVAKKTYAWSIGAGSTATYKIVGDSSSEEKLTLDVTKKGTVELTVTVTVKCSDGTTCSATGSKTFTVDVK